MDRAYEGDDRTRRVVQELGCHARGAAPNGPSETVVVRPQKLYARRRNAVEHLSGRLKRYHHVGARVTTNSISCSPGSSIWH